MKRRSSSCRIGTSDGWHALRLCEGRGIDQPRPSRTQGVPPQRSPQDRRGAFLVIAMICLLLTSGLLGALLKLAVLSRRAAQMEAHSLQADWLAESALDRAAAKLSGDANYQGETWAIKPKDLGGPYAGEVLIAVRPGDATHLREVEAVARYPLDDPRSAQRTKRLVIAVSAPQGNSDTQNSSPASAEKPEEREKGR